jgi:hypothetical protein
MPFQTAFPGTDWKTEEYDEKDGHVVCTRVTTPVGELQCDTVNGWVRNYFLKTAADYRTLTWMIEHSETISKVAEETAKMRTLPDWEVPMIWGERSPIQNMLVKYAGLENFGYHLIDFQEEVMALYRAMVKQFEQRMALVQRMSCPYVDIMENFSADMLGAERFAKFILPVYEQCFPELRASGKLIGMHCDGKTAACRELIAGAPVDLVEALTEPSEGDMPMAAARAAWPDKWIWCNIRVSDYQMAPAQLRARVRELWEKGAVDGRRMAFEMSENLPENWRESVPVVLDALRAI